MKKITKILKKKFKNFNPKLKEECGVFGISDNQDASTLSTLGLHEPVNLELKEANLTQPIIPKNWQDLSLATLSYGYGMSVSLLHMAKAYAILGNGGFNICLLYTSPSPRDE